MSKPLSRPNELGRAIGYRVDVDVILDRLKAAPGGAPEGGWEQLKTDRALVAQMFGRLDFAGSTKAFAHGGGVAQAGKLPKRLWVVMKTERGIPVMLDAYLDKRSANSREKFLRQHMQPEMDQVVLFDVKL